MLAPQASTTSACVHVCMCACGKAGRTARVRVIVLLPRNATAPSPMYTAPPSRCTRHWSGAGPSSARSRGPDRRARQNATRRCARVGDRHAVEHELALAHEHRPAIHLHARGCRALGRAILLHAQPRRECRRHGPRDMRVLAPHADAVRANKHVCMLRLLFNLLPVHKNCQLAITTSSQVLRPHTPAQAAVH